jgi:DNA-binding Lrp family transcriptional regulator
MNFFKFHLANAMHDNFFLKTLKKNFEIPTLKYYIFIVDSVTIAYVLIKSDLGAEEQVVDKLLTIEQVVNVQRTFGDYDMIIKMESEHIEKIREVISWNIKKIDKIRSTLTLVKKE